jgi:hypothetical protein
VANTVEETRRVFWTGVAKRYLPPLVAAGIFALIAKTSANESALFSTIAQVAPTLLLAALIEGGWFLNNTIKVRDPLIDSKIKAKKLIADSEKLIAAPRAANAPLSQEVVELEEAIVGTREQLESTDKTIAENHELMDKGLRFVGEIFAFGVLATAVPLAVLASDTPTFSRWLLALSIFCLGMVASHMYSLYALRFKVAKIVRLV